MILEHSSTKSGKWSLLPELTELIRVSNETDSKHSTLPLLLLFFLSGFLSLVYEVLWVRELGLGLNRAFTKDRVVSDVGTYERMHGVHLSLGAKHNVYKKPDFKFTPRTAKHHVDIFAVTQAVLLDGEKVKYPL